MRIAVFIIAGVQFAPFLLFAFTQTTGSDPAGNAMAQGFAMIIGMVMGVFLVPALILAVNRKALGIALGLSIVPLLLLPMLGVL